MRTNAKSANILSNTDGIITDWLNDVAHTTEKFTTITAMREVALFNGGFRLPELLDLLWEKIQNNWSTAHCRRGGEENWRFKRMLAMHEENESEETSLEKGLATALPRKSWANQVPTASGLISPESDRKRNIDLAYWDGAETVMLIELKSPTVHAKTQQTPLLAAFEIVRNGLLLCLARAYHSTDTPINIARPDVWLDSRTANLRVVAPPRFYDQQLSLKHFEHELRNALAGFRRPGSPELTFAFRAFDLTAIFLDSIEHSEGYP